MRRRQSPAERAWSATSAMLMNTSHRIVLMPCPVAATLAEGFVVVSV
jgi:hypothetical protein